jgi:putative endonuclease
MDRPDRQTLGRKAEALAAAHLEASGAQILLRNFRRRTGELDLVARHADTLLVVEVRLRSREDYGGAAASVDAVKQRRIVRTTHQLLQVQRDLARWPVRFDVMVVTPDREPWRIEWIRHAFEAHG